jgi:hypothetical protein
MLHQEDNTYTSFEGGPFDEFNFCLWKKKKGQEICHNSLLCWKQVMEFLQLEQRMLMKILNL